MTELETLYPLPERFPATAAGVLVAFSRGRGGDTAEVAHALWECAGFALHLWRARAATGALPEPLVELLVRLLLRLLGVVAT
jgi:hypothetical protein